MANFSDGAAYLLWIIKIMFKCVESYGTFDVPTDRIALRYSHVIEAGTVPNERVGGRITDETEMLKLSANCYEQSPSE
jgi:hypothetical protein